MGLTCRTNDGTCVYYRPVIHQKSTMIPVRARHGRWMDASWLPTDGTETSWLVALVGQSRNGLAWMIDQQLELTNEPILLLHHARADSIPASKVDQFVPRRGGKFGGPSSSDESCLLFTLAHGSPASSDQTQSAECCGHIARGRTGRGNVHFRAWYADPNGDRQSQKSPHKMDVVCITGSGVYGKLHFTITSWRQERPAANI